eukprot:3725060-Pyramimonas_sp.AAC.1
MAYMNVQVATHLLLNSSEMRFSHTGITSHRSIPTFLRLRRPPSHQRFSDQGPGAAEQRNQTDDPISLHLLGGHPPQDQQKLARPAHAGLARCEQQRKFSQRRVW